MDFFDGETLIARVVDIKSLPVQGLTFLSNPNDLLQVGVWQYPEGHSSIPHVHNILERTINRTTEVLYVVSGMVHADLYGENGSFLSSTNLAAGQLLHCYGGGHAYRIIQELTVVLEFKNGPYFGAELDRTQFDQVCKCHEELIHE